MMQVRDFVRLLYEVAELYGTGPIHAYVNIGTEGELTEAFGNKLSFVVEFNPVAIAPSHVLCSPSDSERALPLLRTSYD